LKQELARIEAINTNNLTQEPNGDRFFVKSFLLDATVNLNDWGVTADAMFRDLHTFVGKPFVMTSSFGHPTARNGDDLLIVQEKFRVGTIREVGIDEKNGRAFAVSEITDATAIDLIKSGEVSFVSPSIVFGEEDIVTSPTGSELALRFEGAHIAGVKDPAFTILKAQIKGRCSGTIATCSSQLKKVEASVSPCKKFITIKQGQKSYVIANSPCVEKLIQQKVDKGIELDDQQLAIIFSECGESRNSNIDPTSLDNITQIDLLKKKDIIGSLKSKVTQSQTMTEEERKKDEDEEEQSKKAQDEEEDEDEKKDEGKKAEEEDKETVKKLEEEVKALKSKLAQNEKKPVVEKILTAKLKLGKIKEAEKQTEYSTLMKQSISSLNFVAGELDSITANMNKTTSEGYQVRYPQTSGFATASFDSKSMDKLIIDIGGRPE
jgi:hypothetical protein